MATLAEMPLETLQAGMKFRHPQYGEQIILDFGYGLFGPAIFFHNCEVYSGQMPAMAESEEEGDIFQAAARNTYPYGAADWEYLGTVSLEEITVHGWQWFQVACPHCGFVHRLLAAAPSSAQRRCRACGMIFQRTTQPVE